MPSIIQQLYPETFAGGFTRVDGSVEFYTRVNALLDPSMVVLEFGAGRGRFAEDRIAFRRNLLTIKGKVARVVGIDVDPAVMENQMVDEAQVFDGGRIPFPDATFDLIVSDWVFEHLPDPNQSAAELYRVLKPGGWVCARTPHALSLLATVSRLIPNRSHAKLIKSVQPGSDRKEVDVFPTHYRLNSMGAVRRVFPPALWGNHSYTFSPEPGYHFGSKLIARLVAAVQYIKRPIAGENLMVFVRKR